MFIMIVFCLNFATTMNYGGPVTPTFAIIEL